MNQTLRVLSLPEVGLQAVVPSCAADYQRELYSLMRARTLSGTPPPLHPRHNNNNNKHLQLWLCVQETTEVRGFESSWMTACSSSCT